MCAGAGKRAGVRYLERRVGSCGEEEQRWTEVEKKREGRQGRRNDP